jgi:hypothetical protein
MRLLFPISFNFLYILFFIILNKKIHLKIGLLNNKNNNDYLNPNNDFDPLSYLISLNAKNAKLVPLNTYKKREEILSNFDSNDNNHHPSNYKNLKRIVQEMSDKNDYDDITDLINLKDDENTCFYDIKIQNEHNQLIDYKLVNKSQNSSASTSSSYINKQPHLITPFEVSNKNQRNLESPTNVSSSSSSSSSLKVEYVPHGKIITINVSIMW